MGQRDVWVELGQDSFVRADGITKIEASGKDLLVKVSGEREVRTLDLARDVSYPADWGADEQEVFEDSRRPDRLARELLTAIAAAAGARMPAEVSLCVDVQRRRAVWDWHPLNSVGGFVHRSFWDWRPRTPDRTDDERETMQQSG